LPVETELKAPKVTTLTKFSRQGVGGSGYEIHMGQTLRKGGDPLFQVNERNSAPVGDEDGCISPNSNGMGTYIHGLFDNPEITRFWLAHIGLADLEISTTGGPEARDREYDLLAEYFENHIDTNGIMELIQ
jgi:adenosylcobyric acid synthase